jgi:hypothetical protein
LLKQRALQKLTLGFAVANIGCVIYESLNFAGLANHTLAHWLLLAAWLTSILAVYTAAPVWPWAARHRLPITVSAAFLLGFGAFYLYAIDLPLPPPYPNARVVIDINLGPPTDESVARNAYLESNLTKVKEEQAARPAN